MFANDNIKSRMIFVMNDHNDHYTDHIDNYAVHNYQRDDQND